MSPLILVYHPECVACKRLLDIISGIENADITLVNIYQTEINSNIKIDKVPTLIKDKTDIFVGKEVFVYFEEMITKSRPIVNTNKSMYSGHVIPQELPKDFPPPKL